MGSIANIIKYSRKCKDEVSFKSLSPKNWNWKKIIWPFRVLTHPVQAFNEIKYEKRGSIFLSVLILVLWFASNIFNFLEEGFIFNSHRVEDLKALDQFMSSAMIIILWCISNWAICTLMDGEGWFHEIWICNCYSVMPQIISIIPLTLISKVLTSDEGAFVSMISTAVFFWMVLLMFIANTTVHQYTPLKSFISMLLTVLGVLILMLLGVLVSSLFIEIWDFVKSIYDELILRM